MTARREEIPELQGLKSVKVWLTVAAGFAVTVGLPAVIDAWF